MVCTILPHRESSATKESVWNACFSCSDDDYNLALTDGAFSKLIQVQLVRKIEGEQFFEVSCVP